MSADAGPDLLVVGSVNADLVVRVPRHARPGETVLGGDLAVHAGGKGANQAVAAARLGARVAFAGRVGADAYGPTLLAGLREAGVDTTLTATVDGPTGVALITVDASGENAITVAPGANARFTDADALVPALRRVPVVSLQLEIPHGTVAALVRHCAETGTRVVLNPSPGPWHAPADVLRACDPLVVNEHEADGITVADGAPSPADAPETGADTPTARAARALARLRARGAEPRSLVMTFGAAGAVCVTSGTPPLHIPAPEVDAVDTTGAGDAFTGTLAWRLSQGDPLPAAVRLAVRAAAASVTVEGAQPSFPTPARLPQG